MTNPLLQLEDAGQSVWLDYLHRNILETGELQRLIDHDHVKGLTSNPTIFEKAIGEGEDYDGPIRAALEDGRRAPLEIYERIAVTDIQAAADLFRPTHERLNGADGYVSLEVSPRLAMDADATVAEARRLWREVCRPNLMIKVPGTPAGAPAIRQLIGEGINVNVTLLFGLQAYQEVADAHLDGLEAFSVAGGDVSKVHGVASFFVSRIDTQIDREIDRRAAAGGAEAEALRALRGRVAIANARAAYQVYLERLESPRWRTLAKAGASPQRLLWASSGVKDPAYPDVLYAEALIGPDTVDTMPVKTLDAFRDHGTVAQTLAGGVDSARAVLAEARRLGLDLDRVTRHLVDDGVRQFAQSFDALLAAVERKQALLADGMPKAEARRSQG